MKITLKALSSRDRIDSLVVHSMMGDLYRVEAVLGDESFFVCDEAGKPLVFNSVLAAKAPFKGMAIDTVWLQQESAYNEMIGLDDGPVEPLRVPLAHPDRDMS